jgi:hypothetical protein
VHPFNHNSKPSLIGAQPVAGQTILTTEEILEEDSRGLSLSPNETAMYFNNGPHSNLSYQKQQLI